MVSRMVLAAVIAMAEMSSATQSCLYTSPLGLTTDMSILKKSTFYQVESTVYPNYLFYFNICDKISYVDGPCQDGTSSCEVENQDGKVSASENYANDTEYSVVHEDSESGSIPGPVLVYPSPYKCTRSREPEKNRNFETKVYLYCDYDAIDPVVAQVEDDYWECFLHVRVASVCVCGGCDGGSVPGPENGLIDGGDTDAGSDVGTILTVLFFVFTGMYFGIGAVYLRRYHEKTGFDMVPQKEFWTTLPGLIHEGSRFTWQFIMAKYRKEDFAYQTI